MSRLDVLARLAKLRVDEARVALVVREVERDRLIAADRALVAALTREQAEAAQSLDARSTFSAYADKIRRDRDSLTMAIATAETAVDQQFDVLQGCYRELKTYELAIEDERVRLTAQALRRETLVLDEIGVDAARRKGTADRAEQG